MKINDILAGYKNRTDTRFKRKARSKNIELVTEGGGMPNVGAIHISEILPTLKLLEKELGINLQDNVLGSVGKKEFSGDIDIALNIETGAISDFIMKLQNLDVIDMVQKTSVIMTRVKIVDYDDSLETNKKRTGYVQVDFMPGDPDWLKVFYHAPYEKDSKYPGAFRNILLGTLSKYVDPIISDNKLFDGRPLSIERYMFSPRDGLVRVVRTPVKSKFDNSYTKKNHNEIIGKQYKTKAEIANILKLGAPDVLDSFETVFNAIEQNYDNSVVKQIADDLINNTTIEKIGIPAELGKYK